MGLDSFFPFLPGVPDLSCASFVVSPKNIPTHFPPTNKQLPCSKALHSPEDYGLSILFPSHTNLCHPHINWGIHPSIHMQHAQIQHLLTVIETMFGSIQADQMYFPQSWDLPDPWPMSNPHGWGMQLHDQPCLCQTWPILKGDLQAHIWLEQDTSQCWGGSPQNGQKFVYHSQETWHLKYPQLVGFKI